MNRLAASALQEVLSREPDNAPGLHLAEALEQDEAAAEGPEDTDRAMQGRP